MSTDEPPFVSCWCVPPGTAYLMSRNPCTYPNCVSGDRPPPMPAKDDDLTPEERDEVIALFDDWEPERD